MARRADARSRCSRSTRARGARAARCSAIARGSSVDPADRSVFIRSTAAGGPARRPGAGDPGGRGGARGRVRRRRDRDGRRRPVGDRGRRRRRHGRGRRPAGLGRRPAVPQGGDHGDPRRAGRHQGRPRARSQPARWPICARRCRRSTARRPPCWRCPRSSPATGIAELVDGARPAPRIARPALAPRPQPPDARAG